VPTIFPSTVSLNRRSIIEYAQGAGDPVDPTKNIGSWTSLAVNPGNSDLTETIPYTYTGGSQFSFDVYRNQDDPATERRVVFCEPGAGTGLVVSALRQGTSGQPGPTACSE
jgi:hypothetical protein